MCSHAAHMMHLLVTAPTGWRSPAPVACLLPLPRRPYLICSTDNHLDLLAQRRRPPDGGSPGGEEVPCALPRSRLGLLLALACPLPLGKAILESFLQEQEMQWC